MPNLLEGADSIVGLGSNPQPTAEGTAEPVVKEPDQFATSLKETETQMLRSAATPDDPVVQQAAYAAEVERVKQSDSTLFGAAWDTFTAASGLLNDWERHYTYKPDPNFDFEASKAELLDGIPAELHDRFVNVQSLEEGMSLRNQIIKEQDTMLRLAESGWKGTAATMLASLMDVDAPFMALTAGAGFGVKAGMAATKVGRALGVSAKAAQKLAGAAYEASTGAATGALVGGAVGFTSAVTHPTGTMVDAVTGTLGGMVFGGTIGGAVGAATKANSAIRKGIEDYALAYNDPYLRAFFESSAGRKEFGDAVENWIESGMKVKSEAFNTLVDSPYLRRFQELLDKSPLSTDAHTLWNSKSPVANLMAFAMFESAPGLWRNSKSAALLRSDYFAEAADSLIAPYHPAYQAYAKSRGVSKVKAYWASSELKDEFNWEVAKEMNRRELGKPENPHLDPAVKQYCDAADKGTDLIRRRAQETGVEGFEAIQRRSGYMPRNLGSAKIINAIAKAAHGERTVRELLMKAMQKAVPDLTERQASVMAKAFITRARGKAMDMDMQTLNLTTGDSRAFIKETLENHGVDAKDIDGILSVLGHDIEERGVVSHAKRRMPLDLDVSHENISMRDLLDYDVAKVFGHYAQTMAGRSAAAAKGIGSKAKMEEIIQTILREDPDIGKSALGINPSAGKDYLRALMAPFFGGADETHVLPIVRRMTQLTTLGTMSMLGLPQLAETGAQIATVGLWNWLRTMPEVWKMFRGKPSERKALADDLQGLTGHLGREWALHRADLNLEFGRYDLNESMALAAQLDEALAKGLQLQSHLSLFNKVKELQTETLLITYTDKLMRKLRDNQFTQEDINRLLDIGFEPKYLQRLKEHYIDTGTVKFNDKGTCDQANFSKWSGEDMAIFNMGMRRLVNQVIQQGEAGEGWLWARSNVGKLLTQFKSFPMLAVQKQVVRNLALNDSVTYNTAMYGLMTAALAFSVREVINGRTDKLDAEKIAKGAFGMSNLTGWLPMFTDPVASMLGFDGLMFDDYSKYGSADVLNVPAINVLQRMARIPGATLNLVTPGLEFTREDAMSMGVLPIFGNLWVSRRAAYALAGNDNDKD